MVNEDERMVVLHRGRDGGYKEIQLRVVRLQDGGLARKRGIAVDNTGSRSG
jgi:hypothetical protein